jgi:hypothetical protein
MITQRNLFSLIIFTLLFSFGCNGQEKHPKHDHDPEKRAKHQTEWMKTELSLSDDQTAKVDDINVRYAKKMKELREQNRQQMKALHEEEKKELSQVLTKEQNDKLEAKRAEMKAKRKEHFKGKKEGCDKKGEDQKSED